ncbi:MAG: hypothetical protein M9915_14210 [Rhizobacter sp.]|nr:hypothetical protein [Rhizobacter sp.]
MIFRRALGCLVAAALSGLCAIAHAQIAPDVSASAPNRALPPCESATFERGIKVGVPPGTQVRPLGVVVRVLLEFPEVNAEPTVTVTFNSGDQAFADVVIEEAKTYRLPCLKKDNALLLRYVQEVQFVGGDAPKVIWGPIRPAERGSLVAPKTDCFKSADGSPRWSLQSPGGPAIGIVLSRGTQSSSAGGSVIAKITFRGPDVAPETEILFRRGDRYFEHSVRDYVAGYRWTCMKEGDLPVETRQVFNFLPRDAAPVPARLTLQQFLGAVDKIAEQKVRFDFTTMGCPFTFRLHYMMPFWLNDVAEVGGAKPDRREFVEWLRNIKAKPELNLDNKLVDRDFEVSVPCLVLDLL